MLYVCIAHCGRQHTSTAKGISITDYSEVEFWQISTTNPFKCALRRLTFLSSTECKCTHFFDTYAYWGSLYVSAPKDFHVSGAQRYNDTAIVFGKVDKDGKK